MLFNSFDFLLFLPTIFLLYWFVFNKNLRAQNILILLASYFFYAWWDWRFLFLLLLSTIIDFGFGKLIHTQSRKQLFLWLSIVNNLLLLGVFKYYNFFAESARDLFNSIGFEVNPYFLNIVLPVGISFYTFHGMSYVFDIYRGKITPVNDLVEYSVFVSFFPLLVAGPIERATNLLPQVQEKREFNYEQAVQGIRLILWGFFKKIVIADSLASIVDRVYGNYTEYSGATLLLTTIYFSFQIYCDFSGYSDIAIGTAKLFGFELLSNFKFPYFSRNIGEFWRRWHVSLSSWFRDYLYIPLGGSKVGKLKAIRNTFIIFLVSGLWHGANWTFVFWGGINAMLFIPLLLSNKNRKFTGEIVAAHRSLPTAREFMQMLNTFLLVSLARIFFRSPDLQTAFNYIGHMSKNLWSKPEFLTFLPLIILFVLLEWTQRRSEREVLRVENKYVKRALYFSLAVLIVFHYQYIDKTQFIYFQF